MNPGGVFSEPIQNMLASQSHASAPRNWFKRLKFSISWLDRYFHSQEKCVQDWLTAKPRLCSGQRYGDYLSELTRTAPDTSEKKSAAEKRKKTLFPAAQTPDKNTQDRKTRLGMRSLAKRLNITGNENTKTTRPKAPLDSERLNPGLSATKLRQLGGRPPVMPLLTEQNKLPRQSSIRLTSLQNKHSIQGLQMENLPNAQRFNNTEKISLWLQRLNNHVLQILHNTQLTRFIDDRHLQQTRQQPPASEIADNPHSTQLIAAGQRASYALLAARSGLFVDRPSDQTKTGIDSETDDSRSDSHTATTAQSLAAKQKKGFQDGKAERDMKSVASMDPQAFPEQQDTPVAAQRDNLAEVQKVSVSVLHNTQDADHLLSRLTASQPQHTATPLPVKNENKQNRLTNTIPILKQENQGNDNNDLPELANQVKRILIEEARRHGIEV